MSNIGRAIEELEKRLADPDLPEAQFDSLLARIARLRTMAM